MRSAFRVVSLLVLPLVLLIAPALVLAQAGALPDPSVLLPQLISAVQGHNWIVAVGAAAVLATWGLRSAGGKYLPWLRTDRGGAVLALVVGVLGAVGTGLLGGHLSAAVILDGIVLGCTSAGGYAVVRKILLPSDAPVKGLEGNATPPAAPSSSGFLLVRVGVALTIACLVLALGWARAARADDTISTSQGSPLTVRVSDDLTLRANISVMALSYDVTHGAFQGNLPVTGLYVLTSEKLLGAGAGLGLTANFGSNISGELDGAVVSPRLMLGPQTAVHFAVLPGLRFGQGEANAFMVRLAPTLEF